MAVVGSNLTSGGATGSITSQNTASITPSSNNLVLLRVYSRTGTSVEPNAPTATGNGLTWVQVATIYYDTDSSSRKKITVLRALGASPSSGAVTIDFAGQTQTDVGWVIDQFSGVDTSGTNGSGAIVQSATNKDEVSGGGTLTVTLGAFSSVNNATYGAFSGDPTNDGTHPTVGSGFTALYAAYNATIGEEGVTEWKSSNDTSVDATMSSSSGAKMGGIAIEINAAVTATVTRLLGGLMMIGMGN